MHGGDALYNSSQEFAGIALECEDMDRTCIVHIHHTHIHTSELVHASTNLGLRGSSTTFEGSLIVSYTTLLLYAHTVCIQSFSY